MRWMFLMLAGSIVWKGSLFANQPQLYVWEWSQLTKAKHAASNPKSQLADDFKLLHREAEKALKNKSHSVTYNEFVPPSGNKHDYASFGAYWWPDPTQEDGLPFIRRDGETNEAQKALGDKNHFNVFTKDIESLSLAYYLFDDERYAEHAIHLLDDWFLNPETRMNPHLEYAQAVLGRNHGKNSGIIDTRDFIFVLESLELLKNSPAYTNDFESGLKQWFAEFLRWLQTSKHGQKESRSANNHGSWHHAQAMRIAIFLDDQVAARELLRNVRENLIPSQIMPDGTQPEELARTNAFHYSIFNLHALGTVARMGEAFERDLWHDHDQDGRGMQAAAEYLLPFVNGGTDWPHRQISKYRISPHVHQLFRMMSVRYNEPRWLAVDEQHLGDPPAYGHSRVLTAAYQEDQ
jgi:hypothetical protein